MKKCLLVVTVMAFVAAAPTVHAQTCAAVTPSGSGTKSGADWNNAMAGLPSPMVRGVTYYLADGTYPAYYEFSVPVSGTTSVTIKKAVASGDYGQSCLPSIAAGWNGSTMGLRQAVFHNGTGTGACANFWIANTSSTGYLTIDGQIGSGMNAGAYGILFLGNYNSSECKNASNLVISYGYSSRTASNINVKHVEVIGSCGALAEDSNWATNCDTILNLPKGDGNIYLHNCKDCSFDQVYVHDSSAVPFFLTSGNSNITFDHDYVHLNNYTPSNHSEIVDLHGGNDGVVVSNNEWRDVMGTGGFVSLGSGTDTNMYMYDTVIWDSFGDPYGFGGQGFGDGIFECNTGKTCNNVYVYQNTIVNMPSITDGVVWANTAKGTGVYVEDNLWYRSRTDKTFFSLPAGSAEDYNSFLSYTNAPSYGGAHDVAAASSADPFTNWSSGQFTLASDNGDWSNRGSLPAGAWNTDAAGKHFTTDRGAYQFEASANGGADGTGGTGGSGAAGSSGAGGNRSSGGSAGVGGSTASGGSTSAGGSAGSSTNSGTGASIGVGGSGAAPGGHGGCGCSVPTDEPLGSGALALSSWIGVVALWRRRGRRRSRGAERS